MPTHTKPITIGAKSSSLSTGDRIIFRNLTRGGKETVVCNSSGESVISSVPAAWVNGDTVAVEVHGRYNYGATETITTGGINKNIGTLSGDTTTPAINL